VWNATFGCRPTEYDCAPALDARGDAVTRRTVLAAAVLVALLCVSAATAAVLGATQTLSGLSSGERMAVRPYKVARFNASIRPPAGKIWVGVWLAMKNVGKKPYSDTPLDGASLTTSANQTITGSISIGGACANPGILKIASGKSANTCVAFEVPKGARLSAFGFALDAGFAAQKGKWTHLPSL
jgi:hypothetical protein